MSALLSGNRAAAGGQAWGEAVGGDMLADIIQGSILTVFSTQYSSRGKKHSV